MRLSSGATRKKLFGYDKRELIDIVEELQVKLKSKQLELHKVRTKLSIARTKMARLKDTVTFQRKRILELYPEAQPQEV